jgi:membrane protease YdiL (CAAX protease family)
MNEPFSNTPITRDESPSETTAPSSSGDTVLTPSAAAEAALPEDLRAPWDFADMVIFIFLGIGLLFLVTSVLATLAIGFGFVKPELIDVFLRTNAGFIVLRQVIWFSLLVGYLYVVARVRSKAPTWRALGWRGLPGGTHSAESQRLPKPMLRTLGQIVALLAGGALLAFFVQVATLLVGTHATLPIQEFLNDRRSILYMMGFGIAVAPLVEETIFRGFLYAVMARRFGVFAGVILTGIIFGLMHAEQLWGGWGEIGLLVLVGIVFTAARAWSGSVAVSYLLHLGYNGLLFLGAYVATGGLRHFGPGK